MYFSLCFQAQVNVLGTVACKEKCDKYVSVTLTRVAGKSKEERKQVGLTSGSGEFIFRNVFPGKYRLEVWSTIFVRLVSLRLPLFV